MANPTLEKINYQIGRLCRMGSRKAKLMAISNRRKLQLRHLGERVYIFKALQQDEDIWEKDEISQLLLTIADLDQEQEMLIDEINEIKAENPPEELDNEEQKDDTAKAVDTPAASAPAPKTETKTAESKPEVKEINKEVKKSTVKAEKAGVQAKPKAPRKKAAPAKTKAKTVKKDKA
jgi:hypothetical protein